MLEALCWYLLWEGRALGIISSCIWIMRGLSWCWAYLDPSLSLPSQWEREVTPYLDNEFLLVMWLLRASPAVDSQLTHRNLYTIVPIPRDTPNTLSKAHLVTNLILINWPNHYPIFIIQYKFILQITVLKNNVDNQIYAPNYSYWKISFHSHLSRTLFKGL